MMERLNMEAGRVVMSTQGRDAGRYFVVLQVIDDQFVLMADGLSRKIAHPKKKKIKHLRPKPLMVNVDGATLPNKHLQDSDLRRALTEYGLELKPIAGAEKSAAIENEYGMADAAALDKED